MRGRSQRGGSGAPDAEGASCTGSTERGAAVRAGRRGGIGAAVLAAACGAAAAGDPGSGVMMLTGGMEAADGKS